MKRRTIVYVMMIIMIMILNVKGNKIERNEYEKFENDIDVKLRKLVTNFAGTVFTIKQSNQEKAVFIISADKEEYDITGIKSLKLNSQDLPNKSGDGAIPYYEFNSDNNIITITLSSLDSDNKIELYDESATKRDLGSLQKFKTAFPFSVIETKSPLSSLLITIVNSAITEETPSFSINNEAEKSCSKETNSYTCSFTPVSDPQDIIISYKSDSGKVITEIIYSIYTVSEVCSNVPSISFIFTLNKLEADVNVFVLKIDSLPVISVIGTLNVNTVIFELKQPITTSPTKIEFGRDKVENELLDITSLINFQIQTVTYDNSQNLFIKTNIEQSFILISNNAEPITKCTLMKSESEKVEATCTSGTQIENNYPFTCKLVIPAGFSSLGKYQLIPKNKCGEMAAISDVSVKNIIITPPSLYDLTSSNKLILTLSIKIIPLPTKIVLIPIEPEGNSLSPIEISEFESGETDLTISFSLSSLTDAENYYKIKINEIESTNNVFCYYPLETTITNQNAMLNPSAELTSIIIQFNKKINEKHISGITLDNAKITYTLDSNTMTLTSSSALAKGVHTFKLTDSTKSSSQNTVDFIVYVGTILLDSTVFITSKEGFKSTTITISPEIDIDNTVVTSMSPNGFSFQSSLSSTKYTMTIDTPTGTPSYGLVTGLIFKKEDTVVLSDSSIKYAVIQESKIPTFTQTQLSVPLNGILEIDIVIEADKTLQKEYFTGGISFATDSKCKFNLDSITPLIDGKSSIKAKCDFYPTLFPSSGTNNYEDNVIKFTNFGTEISITVTVYDCKKDQEWNQQLKTCNCNAGKGVDLSSKECVDLSIDSVLQNSFCVNNDSYSIKIVFNALVSSTEVTEFTLIPQNTISEQSTISIPSTNCKQESLATTFTCSSVDLSSAVKGTYKLSWNEIKVGKDVEMKYCLAITDVPTEKNELTATEKTLAITYENNLHTSTTFKLYDLNTKKDSSLLTSKIQNKIATFTLTNALPEGKFNIKAILNSEEILTEGKFIYLYKKLTFANDIATKEIDFDSAFSFQITFSNSLFTERIKSVTYTKPIAVKTDNSAIFEVDSNDSTLLTVSTTPASTFDIEGNFIFTITDNMESTGNTLLFTVKIKQPSYPTTSPTLSDSIFYRTTGDSFIKITFKEKLANINMFKTIKGTKTTTEKATKTAFFSLTKIGETNLEFQLKLIEPIEYNFYWGKYDKLEFFNTNDDPLNYGLITFILVNTETIPRSLDAKFASNEVNLSKKTSTFTILFNEEIYSEYFEGDNPKLSITGSILSKTQGLSKSMTIKMQSSDTYYENGELSLAITFTGTPIKITIKLCEGYKVSDTNNACVSCPLENKFFDFDKGICLNSCADKLSYKEQACYTKCSDITLDDKTAYKEETTCVDSCSNKYGLDNTDECKLITIKQISTLLYTKNEQIFDIIFSVKIDNTKVKSFGLFKRTANGDDADADKKDFAECSLSSESKETWQCKSTDFTNYAVGDYNLYWYDTSYTKSTTAFQITILDVLLENIEITEITPSAIKFTDDADSKVEITYKGVFNKANLSLSLVEIEGTNIISIAANQIEATEGAETIEVTILKNQLTEGEYKVKTVITATPTKESLSTQTLLLFKKDITLLTLITPVLNTATVTTIKIEFSDDIFKSRIESISLTPSGTLGPTLPTNIERNNFSVSNKIITINDLTLNSDGDYKFLFKLKSNTPSELIHSIQLFTYPTEATVDFSYPIYYYTADSKTMTVTFSKELPNVNIFSSIKLIDTAISFKIVKLNSNGVLGSFDYSLELVDTTSNNNWNKYIKGVAFYHISKPTEAVYSTISKDLIIVNDATIPKTIEPASINISLKTMEFLFTFKDNIIYPEYFVKYGNNNAKLFIDDNTELTFDSVTNKIKAKRTNSSPIVSPLSITCFGTDLSFTFKTCNVPQVADITDNSCKLCSAINSSKKYYNKGDCLASCPIVFAGETCYEKCSGAGLELTKIFKNECLKECPQGTVDGSDDINCEMAPLIKIISISSPLIEKTADQTIVITTSAIAANYNGKFTITKEAEEDILLECPQVQEKMETFKCPVDALEMVAAGEYKLIWGEPAINLHTTALVINILKAGLESISINQIDKTEFELSETNPKVEIVLTYNAKFNEGTIIDLYDANTKTKIPNDKIKVDTTNNNKKIVKLTIQNPPEGKYMIDTTASDGTTLRYSMFIIIYKGVLTLKKAEDIIDEGIELNQIVIEFTTPLFMGRIQEIKFKETPNSIGEVLSLYSIDKTKLIIAKSLKVASTSLFKFEMQDIKEPLITYTLQGKTFVDNSLAKPVEFIKTIFYYSSSSSFHPIAFDKELTENNMFSLIVTEKGNIQFKLEPMPDDNTKKSFKLMISNPSLVITWGKFPSIKFYAKGDTTRLVHETNSEILIINAIPKTLKNPNIFIPASKKTFILEFYETVYEEFFEDPKQISMTTTPSRTDCSIKYGNSEGMIIECNADITAMTVTIKSFDETIVSNVIIKTCTETQGIDDKGNCIDCNVINGEYFYDKKCYKQCPYGTVKPQDDQKICNAKCGDLEYIDIDTQECTPCEKPKYSFEENRFCYSKCPKMINGKKIYTVGQKCEFKCPVSTIPDINNKCVSPPSSLEECDNKETAHIKCIKCPYGTFYSKERDNCIYDSTSTNISTTIKCEAEDCNKKGICSIINNKKSCKCEDTHFGINCEKTNKEGKTDKEYLENNFKYIYTNLGTINNAIDLKDPSSIFLAVELTSIIGNNPKAIEKVKPQEIIDMTNNLSKFYNHITTLFYSHIY